MIGVAVEEGKVKPGRWHKGFATSGISGSVAERSASKAVKVFATSGDNGSVAEGSASKAVKVVATSGDSGSVAEESASKAVKVVATSGDSGSVAEGSASKAVKVVATYSIGGGVAKGSASEAVKCCRAFRKGERDSFVYLVLIVLCMASVAIRWVDEYGPSSRPTTASGPSSVATSSVESGVASLSPPPTAGVGCVGCFLRSSTEVA
jgi:hypothetical protein